MNRNAGWATALVVAIVAAVRVASYQPGAGNSVPSPGPQKVLNKQKSKAQMPMLKPGVCEEMEQHLQVFYDAPDSEYAAPDYCFVTLPGKGAPESELAKAAAGTSFIIATVPDPAHTHLSLMFDSFADAIQEAAQDSGYTYDSSWMPWESEESTYPLLSDQDEAEDRKQLREDQPGMIFFRKSVDDPKVEDKYRSGLVVFVVGEESTEGIHERQFLNTVLWIQALQRERKQGKGSTVPILGPTFSGSLPSLVKLLGPGNPDAIHVLQPHPAERMKIYSGNLTGDASVAWFLHAFPTDLFDFKTFQQGGEETSRRFYDYLDSAGLTSCNVALISEDETAYGYTNPDPTNKESKRCPDKGFWPPPTFYYPRDISAVRSAYQEQSLFSGPTSGTNTDTVRHTLKNDLADPEGVQHDTIQSYAGSQTALSEEAILLQIVNMLHVHHSQFLLIRSTNPLDQLFLAHFFKQTYPEGRIVIVGTDLLFRREVGANGLDGILTLSNYPSLPDIDHLTNDTDAPHSHRAFPGDGAQGLYAALRFLLQTRPEFLQNDPFLPPNCGQGNLKVSNYSSPIWINAPPITCHVPSVWLSVLGRNGFWPVAAFDGRPTRRPGFRAAIAGAMSADFKQLWALEVRASGFKSAWPYVPLSMNVAVVALFLWAMFHLLCSWWPSITIKPDHRAYFVRPGSPLRYHGLEEPAPIPDLSSRRPHLFLLMGCSMLLVWAATVLAMGYGWLSTDGIPSRGSTVLYAWFPVLIWFMAALSLLGNAWVEHRLSSKPLPSWKNVLSSLSEVIKDFGGTFTDKEPIWSIWLPFVAFTGLTAAFYIFLTVYIERQLPPQVSALNHIRSMNLTTGVSPIVPLLLLLVGAYGWCWFALRGIALFGADQPLLPPVEALRLPNDIAYPDNLAEDKKPPYLAMISNEFVAQPLVKACRPAHSVAVWVGLGCLFVLIVGARLMAGGTPLRSLGNAHYSLLVSIWIAMAISVVLANTWQLGHVWLKLRQLLVFLERLPLRRSMQAMRGFTWGSIWQIGGNVLDLRYKLVYRQIESLNHLAASLSDYPPDSSLAALDQCIIGYWLGRIDATRTARRAFAEWFAKHWNDWQARDLKKLAAFQHAVADTAGMILTDILIPAWSTEQDSLLTGSANSPADADNKLPALPAANVEAHIRNGEEFVCLVFLGFIQNVLGRIRAFVMGMICLFVAVAFVVPSYPFDPRPLLTASVFILFILVAVVVFVVYSQMFRDDTLSHLTKTHPGELGMDFWLKFFSFGVGPILGLLVTLFPDLSTYIFSWIEPSLSSIK